MYKDTHESIVKEVVNYWGFPSYKIVLINTGDELLASSLELSPSNALEAAIDGSFSNDEDEDESNIANNVAENAPPKRFAVKSEEDLEKLGQYKHAEGTKQVTNWGVNVFKGMQNICIYKSIQASIHI